MNYGLLKYSHIYNRNTNINVNQEKYSDINTYFYGNIILHVWSHRDIKNLYIDGVLLKDRNIIKKFHGVELQKKWNNYFKKYQKERFLIIEIDEGSLIIDLKSFRIIDDELLFDSINLPYNDDIQVNKYLENTEFESFESKEKDGYPLIVLFVSKKHIKVQFG